MRTKETTCRLLLIANNSTRDLIGSGSLDIARCFNKTSALNQTSPTNTLANIDYEEALVGVEQMHQPVQLSSKPELKSYKVEADIYDSTGARVARVGLHLTIL